MSQQTVEEQPGFVETDKRVRRIIIDPDEPTGATATEDGDSEQTEPQPLVPAGIRINPMQEAVNLLVEVFQHIAGKPIPKVRLEHKIATAQAAATLALAGAVSSAMQALAQASAMQAQVAANAAHAAQLTQEQQAEVAKILGRS